MAARPSNEDQSFFFFFFGSFSNFEEEEKPCAIAASSKGARAAHFDSKPARARASGSLQAAEAVEDRKEAPRGAAAGGRIGRFQKRKKQGEFLALIPQGAELGSLQSQPPRSTLLQTRKHRNSLVVNRLPDCDVVDREEEARRGRERLRVGAKELKGSRRFFFLCKRRRPLFFAFFETGEKTLLYLPRMDEEVDAVLDTRAVGATTAERAAMACILKGSLKGGEALEG